MATGRTPWGSGNWRTIQVFVMNPGIEPIAEVDWRFQEIIYSMIIVEPKKRKTFSEFLALPVFNSFSHLLPRPAGQNKYFQSQTSNRKFSSESFSRSFTMIDKKLVSSSIFESFTSHQSAEKKVTQITFTGRTRKLNSLPLNLYSFTEKENESKNHA
jgi:hypothetical protein